MLSIKDNTIDLSNIHPSLLIGILVLNEVLASFDVPLVITCGREGKHSNTSLHYVGCAVDVRNRELSKSQQQEVKKIFDSRMNNDFDLVIESNHFHLEYQPKYKP